MTFFLLREAHTKREGIGKLGLAFVLSPIIASLLWAFPCIVFAPILLSDTSEYAAGNYSITEIYRDIAISNCRMAFMLGTPAFVVMLLFFERFRLHDRKNLYKFSALFPMTLLSLWMVYYVMKSIPQGDVGELLIAVVFILFAMGLPITFIAISVACLFWHLGIKNNHWLLNR